MTTWAPLAARACAMAEPMSPPPPTTRATRASSLGCSGMAMSAPRGGRRSMGNDVRIPVDPPGQRGVEIQVAVAQEHALFVVDPAGVVVGRFGEHRRLAGVEERVEVRGLVAALGR